MRTTARSREHHIGTTRVRHGSGDFLTDLVATGPARRPDPGDPPGIAITIESSQCRRNDTSDDSAPAGVSSADTARPREEYGYAVGGRDLEGESAPHRHQGIAFTTLARRSGARLDDLAAVHLSEPRPFEPGRQPGCR